MRLAAAGLFMSASLVASLVCMYQDHLTAPVSLQLLERPWLPASFPAAAKSCCFQVVRHRRPGCILLHSLLLLLLVQHSR
ncbi:TPA: hypothetical protein ACH3X1_008211 [Trebouxia sp. C0004]